MDDLISRQDAIEILRDTPIDIRSTREDDIHTLYATAQNMAIEALRCSDIPNNSQNPSDTELKTTTGAVSEADLISRQAVLDIVLLDPGITSWQLEMINKLPPAQPDKDMIHLQKEQAYMQGWEDGRKALREEIWEDGRDRLD